MGNKAKPERFLKCKFRDGLQANSRDLPGETATPRKRILKTITPFAFPKNAPVWSK